MNDLEQSSQGDMPSVLRDWFQTFMRDEVDDMLPAKVVSYNESTNRAIIQPLVQMGIGETIKKSRGVEVNVPVFRFGGGGFFIRMPIKAGDFGWLKANDRDISLVLQRGGQEDWPNTKRTHDFNDSMFFPDSLKGWTVDGANINSMVLQSLNGNSLIAIGSNGITLKFGSQVVTLDAAGFKHNGTNVGANHRHVGSPTAPNGAISNTGTPT